MEQETRDLLSVAGKAALGALLLGAFVAAPNPMTASVAVTNLLAAAGGVGGDLLTQAAASLVRHWAGGQLPSPIARAYGIALARATTKLQTSYQLQYGKNAETTAFDLLKRSSQDLAKIDLPALSVDAARATQLMREGIDELLHGHDERQVAYLRDRLLGTVAEELPGVLDADAEAARRFQVWLLEDLRQGQAEQKQMIQDIGSLLARLEKIIMDGGVAGLASGFSVLPNHFDVPVATFMRHYTGTPAQSKPFAGRQAELEALTAWLDDRDAPACGLLTAPGGRGKSALIVRWILKESLRSDVAVAFFPVSARFQTNSQDIVFASLYARLAVLHGKVPSRAFTAVEYRLAFQNLLLQPLPDRRQLLLVIDGLDEALDWEVAPGLFPLPLPERVKILVTARQVAGEWDWMTQLGWRSGTTGQGFSLDNLSREAVHEILREQNGPLSSEAADREMANTLFDLAEQGDPLLVGLYVDALWGDKKSKPDLKTEDLKNFRPGLQDFASWSQQQGHMRDADRDLVSQRAVDTLLDVCACAIGPLTAEDICQLAPEQFTSTRHVRRTAYAMRRLLIGTGQSKSGFSFTHPRLAQYFQDHMSGPEKRQWMGRFLQYGAMTLSKLQGGAIQPADTSEYIVRFYRNHLLSSQAQPAQFHALLCEEWLRSWQHWSGMPDGFLVDARTIMNVARDHEAESTGHVVRAALCISSVTSLGANVDGELLVQAVRTQVIPFSRALFLARSKPSVQERAKTLLGLSEWAETRSKDDLWREALMEARSIADAKSRAGVLFLLAERAPAQDANALLNEAIAAAQTISDVVDRILVILLVSKRLPIEAARPLLEDILPTVDLISAPATRADALTLIAERLSREEAKSILEKAIQAARDIDNERDQVRVLCAVAQQLSPEDSFPLRSRALELAQGPIDRHDRIMALSEFTKYLPPEGAKTIFTLELQREGVFFTEWEHAAALVEIAQQLSLEDARPLLMEAKSLLEGSSSARRVDMLRMIAKQLPASEAQPVVAEAIQLVSAIGDEDARSACLIALGEHLNTPERDIVLGDAVKAARLLRGATDRARTLSEIAKLMLEKEAQPLQEEAVAYERAIINQGLASVRLLLDVAVKSPADEAHHLREMALSVACKAPIESDRAYRLMEVVERMTSHDDYLLIGAFQAALSLGKTLYTVRVLCAIANRLTSEAALPILNVALEVANETSEPYNKAMSLICVGKLLPPDLASQAMSEAIALQRSLSSVSFRLDILSELAQRAPEEDIAVVLRDALDEVRSFPHDGDRAFFLGMMIRRLPANSLDFLIRARDIAQSIGNAWSRADLLGAIAERLPPEMAQPVWKDVLSAVQATEDPRNRDRALIALAKRLPRETKLLSEVWHTALYSQLDVPSNGAMQVLAPHWSDLVGALGITSHMALVDTFRALAKTPRRELLSTIAALLPALSRSGGDQVLLDVARAITDTAQWWP